MKKPKIFYVVSYEIEEDIYTNELFDNFKEATEFYAVNNGRNISVAEVKNYYFDAYCKRWNYEDFADTFNFIAIIEGDELTN